MTIDLQSKLDLHAKWLRGANEGERLNLARGTFIGTSLQGADLQGADLRGANLRGANLQDASLQDASLQDASLQDANLQGANLCGANLQGTHLHGADLQGASLQGASLCGANLQGADLRGAHLYGADLQGASLQGADLDILDFSVWPLWCGSFDAKASKRLFAQLIKHVVMLNVSNCDAETQAAMSALRQMPCARWFDSYRRDLAETPETEQREE